MQSFIQPQRNELISPSWPMSTLLQITTCCIGLLLVGTKGLINSFPTSCWKFGPASEAPYLPFFFPMPLRWKRSLPAINTYRALSTEEGHLAVHFIWKIIALIYIPKCKSELPKVWNGSTWNLSPKKSPLTATVPVDYWPLLISCASREKVKPGSHPCSNTIRRYLCQQNPTSMQLQSKWIWLAILFPTKYNWDPEHMDIS